MFILCKTKKEASLLGLSELEISNAIERPSCYVTSENTHRNATSENIIFKSIGLQTINQNALQCESNPLWNFLTFFFQNGSELLVQILHAYYTFLSTLDYKCLFNYMQLWRSYAILSATTIMCSKCPLSTETHAGWSHLIWHYFVTVGDKWIKICILAYIWTFNRREKFGLKIPSCLGKLSENAIVRFGRWRTFCTHDMNWVVTLNMA